MAKKNKPLLTKKKQTWAKQFKPKNAVKGTPLNPNVGEQAIYSAQLERMTIKMVDETTRRVIKLFRQDPNFAQDASTASQARILMSELTKKFTQLFNSNAKPVAKKMVERENRSSKRSMHTSLKQLSGGLSIKTDVMTPEIKDIMSASVQENVGLIKSIPQEYLGKVQGAVMRSISSGNGLADLVPFLEKQKGMTKRRARNIALDQTRKAYNGINRGRMQAIGVKQYEWLHTAGSQKPRPQHIAMSGNIYSLDDPPVIDDNTGERGIPGQLPNCKCRMVPVIKFNDGVPE
jgi:SPP1 gp7 family putative phage head morphogenesis protein